LWKNAEGEDGKMCGETGVFDESQAEIVPPQGKKEESSMGGSIGGGVEKKDTAMA